MTEKMKRKRKRWRLGAKGVMVLIVLLLVLIAAVVVATTRITTITVQGNRHYSEEEVVDKLFPESKDRISLYCYLKNRFGERANIPFIESYEMQFDGADTVEIIVYEKSIVGCIEYMGSFMYFDKDGLVVESAATKEIQVPLVTGLTFNRIVLYQTLPVPDAEVFEDILNLTQLLQLYEIPVGQIWFDETYDATLTLADWAKSDGAVLALSQVRVSLGGREDMEEKISELKNQLTHLSGLRGVLHLETYDRKDLNPQYIFEKD